MQRVKINTRNGIRKEVMIWQRKTSIGVTLVLVT